MSVLAEMEAGLVDCKSPLRQTVRVNGDHKLPDKSQDLHTIIGLRKKILDIVRQCLGMKSFVISQEQQSYLEIWLGEALTNAFKHSFAGTEVEVMIEVEPHLRVALANSCLNYDERTFTLNDEHGYGRQVMFGMAKALTEVGLVTEAGFYYQPGNDHCDRITASLSFIL